MSEKDNGISRRDLLITGSTIVAGSAMGVSLAVDDAEAAKGKKIPQVPRRILGKTKQSIPILLFGAAFCAARL